MSFVSAASQTWFMPVILVWAQQSAVITAQPWLAISSNYCTAMTYISRILYSTPLRIIVQGGLLTTSADTARAGYFNTANI